MLKRATYICAVLMLLVVAYEVMSFACGTTAQRKAKRTTESLATLKLGYTTLDDAKALFQADGVNGKIVHNACGPPNIGDSCDDLSFGTANFPSVVVPLHIGPHDDWRDVEVQLIPIAPVKNRIFRSES
jgi:hypothetical protein